MKKYKTVFVSHDDSVYIERSEEAFTVNVDDGGWSTGAAITNDDACALYEALGDELGLGWLPYPENVPEDEECEEMYLCVVQYWVRGELIDEFPDVLHFDCDRGAWLSHWKTKFYDVYHREVLGPVPDDVGDGWFFAVTHFQAIALPAPYQPKSEE